MGGDVEVRGLDDLARLSRSLRAAGEQGKGLKRELNRSINAETKPTRLAMRAGIVPGLPKSGGLAADVLKSTRFSTSIRTAPSTAGVSIRVKGKRSIRRMNDRGSFRHPLFGRRKVWVIQTKGVHLGFLSKPFQQAAPRMQKAALSAIARVRDQIYRSV
jgi:hypothetical protein